GTFRGFYWSGSQWVEDSSIVAGLSSSVYATPALAFNVRRDNRWILISRSGSMLLGFYWSGSQWVEDSSIVSGISGSFHHAVALGFNATGNDRWILISGKVWGEFHGFYWSANLPPNPPQLNTPLENARFDPATLVTFTWTFNDPDSGDSQSAYRFQLDDNSDFSSPIIDTGKVTSSTTSTTQTLPSTVGLYYWRVKTWDSQNAEGGWSSGRAIIVDKIKIIAGGVVDFTIDIDIGGKVWYYAVYEYDNSTFDDSCGVLYVNGFEMTWDGEKWIYAFPYSTEGNQITFHITGVLDNQYGLTEINNQVGDIIINWATMTIEIKRG
ncbi:MAG: glycoside hydrolase family 78 protein, partial [Candidatus Heimdallarchaeota archaeon]